jgi:membrane protein implicated in regulation of membrane protease activity
MSGWVLWLIAAAALIGGEVLTMGFFLAPIGLAAVVTAAVAAAGGSAELQWAVFIVGSIASLLFVRPIARKHMTVPEKSRTGAARLVGAEAVVLQRVDRDGGRVKIGGEEWTSKAADELASFEPGTRVEVVRIEGATAIVSHTTGKAETE